jgi:hypothetical protein
MGGEQKVIVGIDGQIVETLSGRARQIELCNFFEGWTWILRLRSWTEGQHY